MNTEDSTGISSIRKDIMKSITRILYHIMSYKKKRIPGSEEYTKPYQMRLAAPRDNRNVLLDRSKLFLPHQPWNVVTNMIANFKSPQRQSRSMSIPHRNVCSSTKQATETGSLQTTSASRRYITNLWFYRIFFTEFSSPNHKFYRDEVRLLLLESNKHVQCTTDFSQKDTGHLRQR